MKVNFLLNWILLEGCSTWRISSLFSELPKNIDSKQSRLASRLLFEAYHENKEYEHSVSCKSREVLCRSDNNLKSTLLATIKPIGVPSQDTRVVTTTPPPSHLLSRARSLPFQPFPYSVHCPFYLSRSLPLPPSYSSFILPSTTPSRHHPQLYLLICILTPHWPPSTSISGTVSLPCKPE